LLVHASHVLASGYRPHPSSGACNIILQWNSSFHDGIKSTLMSSLRWCDVCERWSCGWDLMGFFFLFFSLSYPSQNMMVSSYLFFIHNFDSYSFDCYLFFILFWFIFSSISSRIIWFNLIFKSNLVFILLIFFILLPIEFCFQFHP